MAVAFCLLVLPCHSVAEEMPSIEETTPSPSSDQKEAAPDTVKPVPHKRAESAPTEKKLISTTEEEAKPKEIGLIVRKIEIRFGGPKTTNENFVLAHIRTKVGEPFAQPEFRSPRS